MSTTIRDVARKLNISITTVSRALDGYGDVSPDTRREVIRVAEEMGYAPNVAARQLRRQKAETIGYILPARMPRFAEPFNTEFLAGLGDRTPHNKYDLLISSAPPDEEAERQIYRRWVQSRRVDGFVLNRMRLHDWRVDYLSETRVPFVGLERPASVNDSCWCAFIEVDSKGGFSQLVDHLVVRGRRRIAYIGGPENLKLDVDRFAGYRTGLHTAGMRLDPSYVRRNNLTSQGGWEAARSLLALAEPPDAIACANDSTAIGVLRAANELGLRVGTDLAVSGFDGIEEAEHTQPPLTTLYQPLYQIACRLVDMLVDLVAGKLPGEPVVRLQPELRIRASTEG